MAKYRGKTKYREAHPKIFVWSHTEKAEIEYFLEYKHHLRSPLLMPKKFICGSPQELIRKVVKWKKCNINNADKDDVWCVFDVDDFFDHNRHALLSAIILAHKNQIRTAYTNRCFELWILLHFKLVSSSINKREIVREIIIAHRKHALGAYNINQKVFKKLLPFQAQAINNARHTVSVYNRINWGENLSVKGNPSTSIHFLIEKINEIIKL